MAVPLRDPIDRPEDDDILFGSVGEWRVFWRLSDGSCFGMELQGRQRFVNSSIAAFAYGKDQRDPLTPPTSKQLG